MEHEELTQPSNNETLVHITLTYKTPSYTRHGNLSAFLQRYNFRLLFAKKSCEQEEEESLGA